MNLSCRAKWDRMSRTYDWSTWGDERRFAPAKRRLFRAMSGRCLFVGVGTGNDFRHFPQELDVVAIDISPRMIERARRGAVAYRGTLELRLMDVQDLEFAGEAFDTAVTASTFCSVPDPVVGLSEIRRCLKPGGKLLMFEHVRSRIGPVGVLQDLMTPVTRWLGPDMNRDTVGNVLRAGFELVRDDNVYLDVVKAIEARRPARTIAVTP